ncbi:MAG: hypothetical protein QM811_20750 [Pirellulales bacterium]
MRVTRVFCAWLSIVLLAAHVAYANERILLPGYELTIGQNGMPMNPGVPSALPIAPALLPGWSQAGPGFTAVPTPGNLRLIVDTSWPSWPGGYRLVTLEFLIPAPSNAERTVDVELEFGANRYQAELHLPINEIMIPANAASWKHRVLVPNDQEWYLNSIEVREQGQLIRELTVNGLSIGSQNARNYEFHALALHPRANGINTSLTMTDDVNHSTLNHYANGKQYCYPVQYGWAGYADFGQLPDVWQAYTSLDVIHGTLPEFEQLRSKFPAQWQAIRTWVAAGGKLHLETSPSSDAERVKLVATLHEWFPTADTTAEEAWTTVFTAQMNGTNFTPNTNAELFERPWRLGRISYARLPKKHQTSEEVVLRESLTQLVQRPHLQVSAVEPNAGQPPILLFRAAITLFVVLIGPVNYFYFKSRKRLTWLLATVPLGAAITTGLLLMFTLLKDGVSTRAWSAGVTVLDQTRRQAVTDRHVHLFAGIAPENGFAYSTEHAVLPATHGGNSYSPYGSYGNDDDPGYKEFAWSVSDPEDANAREQRFRIGWLRSRRLETFRIRTVESSKRRLDVRKDQGDTVVENHLERRVLNIYLRDEQGKFYSGDAIDVDGSLTLKATTFQDWQDAFLSYDPRYEFAHDYRLQETLRGLLNARSPGGVVGGRAYVAVVEDWRDDEFQRRFPNQQPSGPHVIVGAW